ncbi:MAG TPA: amidase [Chloroflexia bacterium]|nr:amidase [Chloroflexia bacterium]
MSQLTLDRYLFAGVNELANWLREGKTSATELAELALLALQERAVPLNSVANLAPARAAREAARAAREAARADEALKSGKTGGPLQGIPYGAKDLLATADGLPTTWGAVPFKDQQFNEDATAVRLLAEAGATLTAKLSMVELAGGMGYNQPNASLQGPGKNPWNPQRWTGGSSSGSAAAVACGALPFALGSETWGSILSPASYCGVVGFRPTYGTVSRHGAMALSWSLDKIGPYARSAEECARVMEVIGVPDSLDPTSNGRRFQYRPAEYQNRRWRFGLLETEVEVAGGAIAQNIQQAIKSLEKIGTVETISLSPDLPYGEVASIILFAEAAAAFDEFMAEGRLEELTAPEDHINPFVYEVVLAKDYIRALRIRGKIMRHMADLLSEVDFIVGPSTSTTAVPLDQTFPQSMGPKRRLGLSAASNLAGLPAISLPSGLDEQGLPTGMQLVGGAYSDEAVLVAAATIEKMLPPLDRSRLNRA